MNYQKKLAIIGIISFLISITLFFLDIDERVPDIRINIFEIIVLAVLIFAPISLIVFGIIPLLKLIRRQLF